jgi:hypothetical protein
VSTRIKGVQSGLYFLVCVGMTVGMLAACDSAHKSYTVPSVGVEKSSYAPGENIVMNFSNGPGNRYDWIAIYNDGVKPGSGVFTRLWLFTDGTQDSGENGIRDGSLVFDSTSDNPENTERDWPLAAGDYDAYLLCCDDYGVLAGPVEFSIDPGGD